MNIKGFELVNEEKANRALNGTQRGDGTIFGGIVREDGTYDDNALLAEYDKLGGLITKNGDKVKVGSFYDFKNKRPLKEPKVFFVYTVNNKFVEVEEGVELPGEVKAARILEKEEIAEAEEKAEKKISRRKK
jgi:hypothetical protein